MKVKRFIGFLSILAIIGNVALGQSGIYRFPGQIQAASGSIALPSYSFTGDPDTGMYRVSADRLELVVGGLSLIDLQTTGIQMPYQVKIGNGDNFAPGLSFTADPDSGFYRIGTNNVGISVNGAKAIDVMTTGVDITNVLKTGNGTVSLPGIAFISDPDSGIYRIGTNNIGIGVNGAKVLDIGTAGLGVTGTLTASGLATFSAGATVSSGQTLKTNAIDVLAVSDTLTLGANAAKTVFVAEAGGAGLTHQIVASVTGLPAGAAKSADVLTLASDVVANSSRLITRSIRTGTGTDWQDTIWEIRRKIDSTNNFQFLSFGPDRYTTSIGSESTNYITASNTGISLLNNTAITGFLRFAGFGNGFQVKQYTIDPSTTTSLGFPIALTDASGVSNGFFLCTRRFQNGPGDFIFGYFNNSYASSQNLAVIASNVLTLGAYNNQGTVNFSNAVVGAGYDLNVFVANP